MSDWNKRIIEDFRENGGVVGGGFEGRPLLLLHTTGARTGHERVSPLMYRDEGGRIFVFASRGGSPTNPDWYHNLRANPQVTYEIGTETRTARAVEVVGDERDGVYARHASAFPMFAEYQEKTDREIPVIELV